MTYAQVIDVVLQRLGLTDAQTIAITINRQDNTVTIISATGAKHKLTIPADPPRPKRQTTRKTDV